MIPILAILREAILLEVPLPPEARRAYRLLLLVSGMLLAVFILTILLIRSLRRYRQTYMDEPHKPTPSEDVWKQHRLPENWSEQIEPGESDKKDS